MADYEWEQKTLGQNKVIQDIGAAAAKASALVDANAKLAQTTLETGKVLLMGLLNPQLLLLVAIADEIDNFVEDFKGTGFYILEIVPTGNEILPKDADGNPIKILMAPIALTASYTASAAAGHRLWHHRHKLHETCARERRHLRRFSCGQQGFRYLRLPRPPSIPSRTILLDLV